MWSDKEVRSSSRICTKYWWLVSEVGGVVEGGIVSGSEPDGLGVVDI